MNEGDRHRIVCAAFVMLLRSNQVLLARRARHLWSGGSWMFPAGHMEAGETIVEAACREAHEEIGIEIAPGEVTLGHVMHHHENHDRMSFFFVVRSWTGDPVNREPEKCDELRWFSVHQLPDSLPEHCRHALEASMAGITLSTRNVGSGSQAP